LADEFGSLGTNTDYVRIWELYLALRCMIRSMFSRTCSIGCGR